MHSAAGCRNWQAGGESETERSSYSPTLRPAPAKLLTVVATSNARTTIGRRQAFFRATRHGRRFSRLRQEAVVDYGPEAVTDAIAASGHRASRRTAAAVEQADSTAAGAGGGQGTQQAKSGADNSQAYRRRSRETPRRWNSMDETSRHRNRSRDHTENGHRQTVDAEKRQPAEFA